MEVEVEVELGELVILPVDEGAARGAAVSPGIELSAKGNGQKMCGAPATVAAAVPDPGGAPPEARRIA